MLVGTYAASLATQADTGSGQTQVLADHASLLPIFRIAYGHSMTCQNTSCGHAARTVRQYQQRASSFLTIRRPSTLNSYAAPHAQDMRSPI